MPIENDINDNAMTTPRDEAAEAGATVLLGASVFHFNIIAIPELKQFLKGRGFNVRV